MLAKDLARAMETLNVMAEAEEAVEEFYQACANLPGEDRAFWLQMSGEETTHKRYIQKIGEAISRDPENFSLRRPFNVSPTRMFISFIQKSKADLDQGKLRKERILFIARDIEHSLLELSYFEIIKTSDPASEKALKDIAAQTAEHGRRLERKIAENPPRGK
jgi:rubrerythrin